MSRRRKEKHRRVRRLRGATGEKSSSGSPTEVRQVKRSKLRNPGTARQLEAARRLGLSVSAEASPDLIKKRIEEFNRVLAYVEDVWQVLADAKIHASGMITQDQLHRFIGRVLGDGHLASRVEATQREREQHPGTPPKRNAEFRRVASLLRAEFGKFMPKLGFLRRWIGIF